MDAYIDLDILCNVEKINVAGSVLYVLNDSVISWGLYNILCFGQLDPTYRNRPTLDICLRKCRFFSLGSLLLRFQFLKKNNAADPT